MQLNFLSQISLQFQRLEDIKRFSYTFKNYIYNVKTNTFSYYVDGTNNRTINVSGNFISDGWIKLGKYDNDILTLLDKFKTSHYMRKWNQVMQFKANMLNVKYNSN